MPARLPWPWLAERLLPALAAAGLVAASGVALATRYDPDPSRAHASVRAIDAGLLGGVRSAHAWGATALLVLVIVHLAWTWTRAPSHAREARPWYARAALAGVVLAAFLTGGVLAWDQQAWESLEHARPIENPTTAPLHAVFWIHALAVPAAMAAVAVALARPRAWPRITRADALAAARVAAPVVAAILVLAAARPAELGPAPVPGVSITRPEWPFLWLVPLQDWWGRPGLVVGLGALAIGAAAAPWLAGRLRARARVAVLWGLAVVLGALSLLAAYG